MANIFGEDLIQQPSTLPAPADPEIEDVLAQIKPMDEPAEDFGPPEPSTTIVIAEEDMEDDFLEPEQGSEPAGPKAITGVLITGRQDGLFAAFDEPPAPPPLPPVETSPSSGKSMDDLEREAITEGLSKLGFKIEVGAKFTNQDWKDLRQLLLERRWITDLPRLVQAIHLILSISSHVTKGRTSFSQQERRNPMFLASKLMERLRDMDLDNIVEELTPHLPSLPERLPPKPPPLPKKP